MGQDIKKNQIGKAGQYLVCFPFLLVFTTVFFTYMAFVGDETLSRYLWFFGVMILIATTMLLFFLHKKVKISISINDILILIFCFWGIILTWMCNEGITMRPVILMLLLCLYFYFRILFTSNKKYIRLMLLFLVFLGLIEAILGLRQLYGFTYTNNLFKTTGSFINPGPFAGYLATIFPIALFYGIHGVSEKNHIANIISKIFAGLTVVVIFIILPSTLSRASWLAMICGSFIVIYGYYNDRIKKYILLHKNTIKWAGIVVLISLIISMVGIYRFKKDSADGRILMWKVALQALPKYPFGVGLGNYPGTYADEQAEYFASGQATEHEEYIAGNPDAGFNEYLQIAVEWGIFPFLLFVTIIFRIILSTFKRKQFKILASIVSILVFSAMSFPFSLLPFLIIFVFLLAASESGEVNETYRTQIIVPCSIIAVLFFLLTSLCLYNRFPIYSAYKKWNSAKVLYYNNHLEEAIKKYEEATSYLKDKEGFMLEYSSVLSDMREYDISIKVLQKASRISGNPMIYNRIGKNYQAMKDYKHAEESYTKAARIVPNRLYPWYLLTKLYNETGQKEKAQETAKVVLTKETKVRSLAIREMREEVKKYLDSEEKNIEQYFQQKGDTLLLKSWLFLKENSSAEELKQYANNEFFLITDIELAVNTSRQAIETGKISFDLFSEYILPIKIYDEPIENWREVCLKDYLYLKNKLVLEICDSLNNIFKKVFKYGENPISPYTISWSNLKDITKGDCYHMAKTLVYPLRALGIPTTIDFIHSWGNANGVHCWNVAYIDGKMVPFMGRDSVPYHFNPFFIEPDTVMRFPAKVFRKTFSINGEIEDLKKGVSYRDIPFLLKDSRIKDVSAAYFPVFDIKLNNLLNTEKYPLVYLSVFSNGWKLVAATKNLKNKPVIFNAMKGDMLYLPAAYKNENIIPIGYPIIVDNIGNTNVLKPDTTIKKEITIKYLYPLMMENLYALSHRDELPNDIFNKIKDNTFRHRPEQGKIYSVLYWINNRWEVCDKQCALADIIKFGKIPANALFHLTDENEEFIGRCFTIEGEEMVWW
jgi:O-antigen ligase